MPDSTLSRRILLAGLTLALAGCAEPAAEPKEKLREDGLTELQWQVLRAQVSHLCDTAFDFEGCIDRQLNQVQTSSLFQWASGLRGGLAAKTIRLREPEARAWLATIAAAPYSARFDSALMSQRIWDGTRPAGAACWSNAECLSQSCGQTYQGTCGTCDPVTSPGTPCTATPHPDTGQISYKCPWPLVCNLGKCEETGSLQPGQACTTSQVCPYPTVCRDGTCTAGLGEGEDCLLNQCAAHLQCLEVQADTWRCATSQVVGLPCQVDTGLTSSSGYTGWSSEPGCGTTMVCVPPSDASAVEGMGTCQPRRFIGESCKSTVECGQTDGLCKDGTCQALPAAGEPCAPAPEGLEWWTNSCRNWLFCSEDRLCFEPGPIGAPCEYQTSCNAGLACNNGSCQPLGREGDSCVPGSTNHCASGFICTTKNGGECERYQADSCSRWQ